MADGLDAFSRLELEHERTLFAFYGWTRQDGTKGGSYFRLANSLSETLADLHADQGVADEGGYFALDAFIADTKENRGPCRAGLL
jgi:hypothetical protein